ncbi:hypothetical protein Pst134EA_013647 [Puccinia striiformis f. sp. tritici]|uniref:Cyclopropane-fatty-acyl-phospholipid synthase n=1 Tax=Puccinia striiformis TaxID=27350 RepID=A0A2S4UUE1_9BASI|nr:hypothetical protein Pst134EA_013647 [Puccinia striiformis f. sp. tritici]KAH9465781.1 hypothetical protein Pst134EA_013647 [Puccinia striiformis f. sp. tritici]POW00906.1 hypothetical protein PSTT_12810 [Puccinia striiformis]
MMYEQLERLGYQAIDRGLIPDWVLRRLIRFSCSLRLKELEAPSLEELHRRKFEFIDSLRSLPVAVHQESANVQHYEVPTELMKSCLGEYMKYSCCYFPKMNENLDEGEILMLQDYCEKAKLVDGLEILDLGCGWGSLSLYLAQKYPNSKITALSNSRTQKIHIDQVAKRRELNNLTVLTDDVMVFDFPSDHPKFDRIISIEMLEHMKNYEFLFKKISSWLKAEGLFFAHIFCHKDQPYHFEEKDGWMAQNFFSGGTMPSLDLFSYIQRDLNLERSWYINGQHYSRTSELWLEKLDQTRAIWTSNAQLIKVMKEQGLDKESATIEIHKNFYKFRTFFLAVAEFFGLNHGQTWGVGHYLFSKKNLSTT